MTTLTRFLAILSLTALVAACGSDDTDPGQQMHANAGIPVDVAPVVSQRLTEWDSFTGRLEAPQTVSLRPRVSGYIEFVAFEEGNPLEGDATRSRTYTRYKVGTTYRLGVNVTF